MPEGAAFFIIPALLFVIPANAGIHVIGLHDDDVHPPATTGAIVGHGCIRAFHL